MTASSRYVPTEPIKQAVRGHEGEILSSLVINWREGRPHIPCPYPSHNDDNPSWRWDEARARAFCSCTNKPDSVFDVVMKVKEIDFDAAKLMVAEIIGRGDLIRVKGGGASRKEACQKADAASLLAPPEDDRDDSLPIKYLAFRLGVSFEDVPRPATACKGRRSLAYFISADGAKEKIKGHYPAAVFKATNAAGDLHAMRIYLAPDGAGKADLEGLEPKKAAVTAKGESRAGCAVLWGNISKAPHAILAEGIETAAAIALACKAEIEAEEVAVAAALTAGGVEAFKPWPSTIKVTVAADRDEAPKADGTPGSRRGEKAARTFGLRHRARLDVRIAMPGSPGEKVDWLDVLRRDGAQAVRDGILSATLFALSPEEECVEQEASRKEAELEAVRATYPLPDLDAAPLVFRHSPNEKIWIHKVVGQDKSTGEPITKPVLSPLGVPARLRYADQADAYGLRVVVQGLDGQMKKLDLERSAFARKRGAEVLAPLYAAGLLVENDGEHIAAAILKAADPQEEIVIMPRPGWHHLPAWPSPIFVSPAGDVFGLPEGVSLELAIQTQLQKPVVMGTLEGWKRVIAAALSVPGCPHWLLAVAAAFAGPLVGLAGLDSCGVCFSGLSSGGKSTGQKLGVSVWGNPRLGQGLMHSMRTTANAVEALAQGATGTLLALDELGHADGRDLGRLVYSLSGGVGKARMNADATLKEKYSWSTFIVLSGEMSLEEKVRAEKLTWTAGMAARIVDIDITDVNRSVPRSTMDVIESASQNYGHAGVVFIQAIIADGLHQAPDELRSRILGAAKSIAGDEADSVKVRAATPFALLLVAGELAMSIGLLPPSADLAGAVNWAWNAFLRSSDAMSLDPEEHAISSLRAWIAQRWNVTIKNVNTQAEGNSREPLGWYDEEAVYIPVERIREATGNTLKVQQIGRILKSRGLIAKVSGSDRLTVKYIPRVSRNLPSYALRIEEFGRLTDDMVSMESGDE